MKRSIHTLLFFLIILTSSCGSDYYVKKSYKGWEMVKPGDSVNLQYALYLIGDAGRPDENSDVFKILRRQILKDSNSALVFLGDNIYNYGLPTSNSSERAEAEKRIILQMNIVKDYKGQVYFISGNHDWQSAGPFGWPTVVRQEAFIEKYLNRGNTYIPDFGCMGPHKIDLSEGVVLVAIDSQWWLHMYDKPVSSCRSENQYDFLTQLEDIIKRNKNRYVVIVAHHPLFSNGNHGGYFNVTDHIFPLRIIRKNAYIPLPVLGSLYPLYRKFGGTAQDMAHYKYQEYKNGLINVLSKYDNVIFAAGHDHNLQYHVEDSIPHIISGSGSKLNQVAPGHNAIYTHQHKGFAKLKFYNNAEVWLEYWIPDADLPEGELAFRVKVHDKKEIGPELNCALSAIDYKDSTRIVKATERYKVSKFKKFLFGNHYRKAWITPIEVKVLDLKRERGGLIPYGKGGGKQSVSLKAKNIEGKEYVLRSINKDPIKVIPKNFRNTVIQDIVEDQISAQHPYGALVVPKLADAAKVLHTNPEIRVIPEDSCLGPYKEEFKNMLVLFEEDPDENHEDVASLGNAKNIVGTEKVIEQIEEDNDHYVIQESYLRSRLLDMLIGDWDRHEGQYRWAEYKTEKGEYYKAIPEDRDQVFFKFDGIIPYLSSRPWAIRNLQNFEKDYDDIIGLNLSAKTIDRRFLSGLSKEEWIVTAIDIQKSITDEVIETAVKALPDPVYTLHSEELVSKLKSRRDALPEVANKYYKILAKYVDVYGSNKHEEFLIERVDDEKTKITVFKTNSEGERKNKIYERTFLKDETNEIRLYGLGGEDKFVVSGEVKDGIKIRIIGGNNNDTIIDGSSVKGLFKKTIVYDTDGENIIEAGNETNLKLDKNEVVNYPGLDRFRYNYLGPQFDLFYNQDDGLFIGAGFIYEKYKFRTAPYGVQHRFLISRATSTGSTRIFYEGDIKKAIGGWDLGLHLNRFTPAFAMNFFGFGNNSVFDNDVDFYRTKLDYNEAWVSLNRTYKTWLKGGIGPKHEYYNLKFTPGTFLAQNFSDESADLYSGKHYVGLRAFLSIGTQDNNANPTRGIFLSGEANLNQQINGDKDFYQRYQSEFRFYLTPNFPFQLTFAGRIGGAVNYGEYEFYQANMLGGTQYMLGTPMNLRGYRKTRFIGDKSLYTNAEVRCQILRFNAYIFPGKLGLLGFFDNGRVWARNESSNQWHAGYGGGIWLDIYDKVVLTTFYAISEEDSLYNFRIGFVY